MDTTLITSTVTMITSALAIFIEPPIVWFVYVGLIAAGIGVVSKFVRRR